MKFSILFSFFLFLAQMSFSQDFITQWRFADPSAEIQFNALTTDTVYYTWNNTTSGNSGSGQFIKTTPGEVTISGISFDAYDKIMISMTPDHLSRFYFEKEIHIVRGLVDVLQWGDVSWTSMSKAFFGCGDLFISATDIPDLMNVTQMDSMFCFSGKDINNIVNWDVSNVTDMNSMFLRAGFFNQDIGSWDVSNVTDMSYMFRNATSFDQDIGNWDVANVTDLREMFRDADIFNQDIGDWNVSNVTNMTGMFAGTLDFNQDIGDWDVSNVTDLSNMFSGARSFNGDIGSWDVSNVTDMSSMFSRALKFNQNIGNWDVANVTDMGIMFSEAESFNQDIGSWDVSNVANMSFMFSEAISFNREIGSWDVSNVTDMYGMFSEAFSFNQEIGSWDVANVTDMSYMFWDANFFNQDIGEWNVSNVTRMYAMFRDADSFNQDLGNWNVSNVTDMRFMFYRADSFNQNIGSWTLHPDVRLISMLDSSGMDCDHYSATLVGWRANNPSVTDVTLGAAGLQYGTTAVQARDILINAQGWTINDDEAINRACDEFINEENQDFITQWVFSDTASQIHFNALTTDTVHYTWKATPSGNSGIGSFTMTSAGAVTLSELDIEAGDTVILNIAPENLSRFYMYFGVDRNRLIDVIQWGAVSWTSMSRAFYGCTNLQISAIDTPNLTGVTDFGFMFGSATSFNQDISFWDVSNATNMASMFANAYSFNQDIGDWDVSNVTDMSNMFFAAIRFNQDVGGWDVSNVTNMSRMFRHAIDFDQDIGRWNVSKVTNMYLMFNSCDSFNQNLGDWRLHPNVYMGGMLGKSGMDCDHYSETLVGWYENNSSVYDVTLGASEKWYGTTAVAARDSLIKVQGWTINGDGASFLPCGELVSTEIVPERSQLTIYPNPTTHRITVKGDQIEFRDTRVVNTVRQDVTGQTLIQQESASRLTINLSGLPAGLYVVQSSGGSGVVVKE